MRKATIEKIVFYEKLEQVFDHFPNDHIEIILGDFNAKAGREKFFKPTIGNYSLHQDNNDTGVIIEKFGTSKNLVVKSTIFPHQDIHKYNWISPDGKTQNKIDHILLDRRWYSSTVDVGSFCGNDCDTDHCLVVVKVRERLVVSETVSQKFDEERFNLRKVNELKVKKQYQIEIKNRFAALEN